MAIHKFLLSLSLVIALAACDDDDPATGDLDAGGAADAAVDSAPAPGDAGTTSNGSPSSADSGKAQLPGADGGVPSATAFFFGHSLVGWDMPAMVGSFANARQQRFSSHGQIGWGTSLQMHVDWNGDRGAAPAGFETDSFAHAGFVGEGKAQLDTGDYDVLVLTESNGHTATNGDETVRAALTLARRARAARASVRIFLYANWLDRDDFASLEAWQARTASDLSFWEGVADRVNAELEGADVMVLPIGQILAEVTAAISAGSIGGVSVDALFREGDGVHVNDLGFYLVAAAHYAAIFRETPVGLPVAVQGESGPADVLPNDVASALQAKVWSTLTSYPRSGLGR